LDAFSDARTTPNDIGTQTEGSPVAADAPLFIVMNAGSGSHAGEDVRSVIRDALESAGRTFSLHEVDEPDSLESVAKDVVGRAQRSGGIVVGAGGDGTINTVAKATLGSGRPFGVIPLGTFNYFSRAHGIPSDAREACRILVSERAHEVQVGLVNNQIFLVNASIGLYPDLLEEREQAKQELGRSRWVAAGAALLTLLRSHRSLVIDVETPALRCTLITPTLFVGNNRLQLERAGIPGSELIERHRLVAVAVRPVSTFGTLKLVARGILGRLGDAPEVTSFALEQMKVRSRLRRRRMKVAADGEVMWLNAPLAFRVAPHPLLLIRPAEVREDPG
jgi:diacylglycerol kinase family enzyme